MSLDQQIKEAFERHAPSAERRPEAWAGIERAIGRSHRRLILTGVLGVAAAIVAAALIVPRIATSKKTEFPIRPGPVSTVGWTTFESKPDGFTLSHPRSWTARRDDQSDITVLVPNDVARDGGKPLFSLEFVVNPGDYRDGLLYRRKAPEFQVEEGTLEGGYPYVRIEHRIPNQNVSVRYLIDWTTPLCKPNAPCPRPAEGIVLAANISASMPSDWSRYGPTAEQIVQSIRAIPREQASSPAVLAAKIPVAAFDLAVGDDALWALQRSETQGAPGKLIRIDPASNRPTLSVEVGVWPTAVAAGGGDHDVWVVNGVEEGYAAPFPLTNSVMRVDARTGRVLASIRVNNPQDVAVGARGVWVTATGEGPGTTLLRFDQQTNELATRIALPASEVVPHLVVAEGLSPDRRDQVWVTTRPQSTGGPDRTLLHRVEASSNKLVRTITIPAGDVNAPLAVGFGSIWVGVPGTQTANALARVDQSTERFVTRLELPDAAPIGIVSVTTGEGYVWASGGRGSFWKINPHTSSRVGDPIFIGDDPPVGAGDVVYGLGSLWVASGDGTIWRLEP